MPDKNNPRVVWRESVNKTRAEAHDLLTTYKELLSDPAQDKFNSIKARLTSVAEGAITDDSAVFLVESCKKELEKRTKATEITAKVDSIKKEKDLKPFKKDR